MQQGVKAYLNTKEVTREFAQVHSEVLNLLLQGLGASWGACMADTGVKHSLLADCRASFQDCSGPECVVFSLQHFLLLPEALEMHGVPL